MSDEVCVGMTSHTYTLEDCLRVRGTLLANHGDIVKAFDVLWRDGFFFLRRCDDPVQALRLIDKVLHPDPVMQDFLNQQYEIERNTRKTTNA